MVAKSCTGLIGGKHPILSSVSSFNHQDLASSLYQRSQEDLEDLEDPAPSRASQTVRARFRVSSQGLRKHWTGGQRKNKGLEGEELNDCPGGPHIYHIYHKKIKYSK